MNVWGRALAVIVLAALAALVGSVTCSRGGLWLGEGHSRTGGTAEKAGPARRQAPASGRNWTVPEVGLEFVWIDALKLWVGMYEVTNGEYRQKEPRHDSGTFENHGLNGDRQPVVQVDWHDAVAYAAWLTERERAAGRLPEGLRYRLPTEDEFLACAQCGDEREYPWGSDWPPQCGQAGNCCGEETRGMAGSMISGYDDEHPVSCAVERSWANPWGLHGVGGNVWECCAKDAATMQSFGAWRGASWCDCAQSALHCSYRNGWHSSVKYRNFGFRLVLSH